MSLGLHALITQGSPERQQHTIAPNRRRGDIQQYDDAVLLWEHCSGKGRSRRERSYICVMYSTGEENNSYTSRYVAGEDIAR